MKKPVLFLPLLLLFLFSCVSKKEIEKSYQLFQTDLDKKLFIGATDNGMLFDEKKLESLSESESEDEELVSESESGSIVITVFLLTGNKNLYFFAFSEIALFLKQMFYSQTLLNRPFSMVFFVLSILIHHQDSQ